MNNLKGLSEPRRVHHQTPCNTNTQPFCHNPRGSDKVQTSANKKRKGDRVTSIVFFKPSQGVVKGKEGANASSPCDYSLKLAIIRSQTWFTPCSSLIVLKSSVTRRRRIRASKHTHVQAETHTQMYTKGRDSK